jgi:hypothetical protein
MSPCGRFALILAPLVISCGTTPRSPAPGSSGDSAASAVSPIVADPNGAFDLVLPTRWASRYRVDSLSTAEQGRGLPGSLLIQYLPADTTIRPQALVAVVTYDSASWREVSAEEGPPPGDSVAARNGKVFVIGLPQSNPFPPTSPDAATFDRLTLRPAEVARLIRFR